MDTRTCAINTIAYFCNVFVSVSNISLYSTRLHRPRRPKTDQSLSWRGWDFIEYNASELNIRVPKQFCFTTTNVMNDPFSATGRQRHTFQKARKLFAAQPRTLRCPGISSRYTKFLHTVLSSSLPCAHFTLYCMSSQTLPSCRMNNQSLHTITIFQSITRHPTIITDLTDIQHATVLNWSPRILHHYLHNSLQGLQQKAPICVGTSVRIVPDLDLTR